MGSSENIAPHHGALLGVTVLINFHQKQQSNLFFSE